MRRSLVVSATVVVAACALAWAADARLAAQGAGPRPTDAAGAAYTAPRTPWGDPDLQGTYTSTFEQGTPLERPDEFKGRRLEDITPAELLKQRQAIQARTIGNFQGPIHAPDHWWQANLEAEKGSQAWLIIDPPDGKIPALTAAAQQRNAARAAARKASRRGPADSWEDRSLYDRCLTRGLLGSAMPSIYGNSSEIVQGPGFVAIRYEMIHETRVIPLDGRPHVAAAIGQDMGDSRGRWEGDTLVVETRRFRDRSVYRNADPDSLVIVERFRRTSPTRVQWTVTVNDPNTWTAPWTFTLPFTADDNPVPSYECHEGNYGLRNILSAARAEEAEAARTGRPVSTTSESSGDAAAPAEGR